MTHRERIVRVLSHKPVDRIPDYEFGAWPQTVDRWLCEGLPAEYGDPSYRNGGMWGVISEHFQTDDYLEPGVSLGTAGLIAPPFEQTVLEERGDHLIIQDEEGVIYEMLKPELGASIPKYLKFPIESRKDWERFRDEHLDPQAPGRLVEDIDAACEQAKTRSGPVTVFATSLYGKPRNYMGVERLSLALYDDPEWVEQIMEHLTWMTMTVLEKLAGACRVDVASWWEDMCYRNGPLISPEHFARWMVPRYRRITDFLARECGCRHNVLDSDGNIHALAGLWLDGGINCMFPLEAAHTDVYALYHEFGPRMGLRGAFDKRALIEGPEAIDAEFQRLLPLVERQALVMHVDHLVPPDVSYDNYCYYRRRKLEVIGKKPPG
jgi:uroporphyrinogen-III decarboxylase